MLMEILLRSFWQWKYRMWCASLIGWKKNKWWNYQWALHNYNWRKWNISSPVSENSLQVRPCGIHYMSEKSQSYEWRGVLTLNWAKVTPSLSWLNAPFMWFCLKNEKQIWALYTSWVYLAWLHLADRLRVIHATNKGQKRMSEEVVVSMFAHWFSCSVPQNFVSGQYRLQ